jgi:hypothetical protein
MWCSSESDGTPLKWHRPNGVLFDSHGSPSSLPWAVVVHFTKFPRQDLLNPERGPKEDVQWHFMNTMKEAIFLQYGSTKPLTSLKMEKQEQVGALAASPLHTDAVRACHGRCPRGRACSGGRVPRQYWLFTPELLW